ncbi:helix-turn-helix transcriptional regulator [Micromonospora echinofusca]|uniref:Helix-turn-helix transcriptional regulator n=1 Tax=Micromonospora echinofusca TaxID=47858 RepID=A0ABS3VUJ6_MICEH|nr:helix-turn-helix transcriptional regulator [Micromonospora echinofusca]MBO4208222.1 helix-turn-helix transcriptional regulator [Micromonospora echinofusca]
MRTVLVCVRTPLAAQHITAAAARLGLSPAVRTAVSDPEVMLRLAERPADVVLADTALARPDSAGFVRRVLARAPRAAVLLLGAAEPGVAAGAISAGARGLIPSADHDLVSAVAKALLLIAAPIRPGRRPATVQGGTRALTLPDAGDPTEDRPAGEPVPPEVTHGTGDPAVRVRRAVTPAVTGRPAAAAGPAPRPGDGASAPTVVPVQRGDDVTEAPGDEEPGRAAGGRVTPTGTADRSTGPGGRPGDGSGGRASGRAGGAAAGEASLRAGAAPGRSVALTERELQVLLGMADGKSNAEIGRELFVSEDTVKTHARRLFRKLGARDRAHAVAAGFRAGLVA